MKRATLRKVFDWILGSALIVVGIIGLFMPVLQGAIFILAGLAVLSSHSRWAKAAYDRIRSWGRAVRERVHARRGRHRAGSEDSS